jgi:penicillin-insensitive murein endopeptidase
VLHQEVECPVKRLADFFGAQEKTLRGLAAFNAMSQTASVFVLVSRKALRLGAASGDIGMRSRYAGGLCTAALACIAALLWQAEPGLATQSTALASKPATRTASADATAVPMPERKPPAPAAGEAAGQPQDEPPDLKKLPANALFASVTEPTTGESKPVGFYTHGCIQGAEALPMNGPDWQVMRPSRDRYWGTHRLVHFIERFASDARAKDGWPGLMIGDMSQPRGGPMVNGHGSHQVGLDVDVWFTPMPDRILKTAERETIDAQSLLKDPFDVDPKVWSPEYVKLIKRAVSYPDVARIFVHPAIKKQLCEDAGSDKSWLAKVRPWWGHYSHMHIRLTCPAGVSGCENQPPVSGDDGCGAEIDNWYAKLKSSEIARAREKSHSSNFSAPSHLVTLSALPKQCTEVLLADGNKPPTDPLQDPVVKRILASDDASPPPPDPTPEQLQALLEDGRKAQVTAEAVPMPERRGLGQDWPRDAKSEADFGVAQGGERVLDRPGRDEREREQQRNVFGEPLASCSERPLTGFYRTGCCHTGSDDRGMHTVCVEVTAEFLEFSKQIGNDLSTPQPDFGFPGLQPGDRWCLCAPRWMQALAVGMAPRVCLAATNEATLEVVPLEELKRHALDLL